MPLIHLPLSILKHFNLGDYLPFCLKCSNCQLCPITQFSHQYSSLNSFVYDIISSEDPLTNINLWKCVSCHSCENVCPYDISPNLLFLQLKETSFQAGKAPTQVVELVNQIIKTGRGFGVTPRTQRLRKNLSLSPLRSSHLMEIQLLIENTNVKKHLKQDKR